MTFEPPKGTSLLDIAYNAQDLLDASQLADDDEIWLFRVPLDFPLTELHQSNLSSLPKTLKVKSGIQGEKNAYTVQDITTSGDVGELKNMTLVLPSAKQQSHRIITKKPSKFISIEPKHLSHNPQELAKNGQEARDLPYVARSHPEGLKFQSPPFGYETEGKSLQESLERYGLSGTPTPSSNSTSDNEEHEPRDKSQKKRKLESEKSSSEKEKKKKKNKKEL